MKPPTSLRTQLLIGSALGTTLVLVAAGLAMQTLMRRALLHELDQGLAAQAASLAASFELDEDGLEFELLETGAGDVAPGPRGGFYQVWLPDGLVYARSPALPEDGIAQRRGPAGSYRYASQSLAEGRPGRVVWHTFVPRREGGPSDALSGPLTLALGWETGEIEATLQQLRGLLLGVGVLAVATICGVLALLIRRSLRPVAELSRQIERADGVDLTQRLAVADLPRELVPVVDRFNQLLTRVADAFQRERRFSGDVAHELRTPLAGLRSQLELALSRERDARSYRQTLQTCLRIDRSMQKMVENLLQLARADGGQLQIHAEPFDLADLLGEVWEGVADVAGERGLQVAWQARPPCPIDSDRDRVGLILRNLLENAVTCTTEGGCVRVEARAGDESIELTIQNATTLVDAGHVFERFWRGDPARHDTITRCGIGLPLCQAVTAQLGGRISAEIAAGTFVVRLQLPRRIEGSVGPDGLSGAGGARSNQEDAIAPIGGT